MQIVVLLLAILAATAHRCSGFTTYMSLLPNAALCTRGGTSWPSVGHSSSTAGGPLNPFGSDFVTTGYDWSKLCELDSDGDGYTNGQELGDPLCTFVVGSTDWVGRRNSTITHPGYADSAPVGVTFPNASSSSSTLSTKSKLLGAVHVSLLVNVFNALQKPAAEAVNTSSFVARSSIPYFIGFSRLSLNLSASESEFFASSPVGVVPLCLATTSTLLNNITAYELGALLVGSTATLSASPYSTILLAIKPVLARSSDYTADFLTQMRRLNVPAFTSEQHWPAAVLANSNIVWVENDAEAVSTTRVDAYALAVLLSIFAPGNGLKCISLRISATTALAAQAPPSVAEQIDIVDDNSYAYNLQPLVYPLLSTISVHLRVNSSKDAPKTVNRRLVRQEALRVVEQLQTSSSWAIVLQGWSGTAPAPVTRNRCRTAVQEPLLDMSSVVGDSDVMVNVDGAESLSLGLPNALLVEKYEDRINSKNEDANGGGGARSFQLYSMVRPGFGAVLRTILGTTASGGGTAVLPFGGVFLSVVYNLPANLVPRPEGSTLVLTRCVAAGILLGEITKWDNSEIVATNREFHFPSNAAIYTAGSISDPSATAAVRQRAKALWAQCSATAAAVGSTADVADLDFAPGISLNNNSEVALVVQSIPMTLSVIPTPLATQYGLAHAKIIDLETGISAEPTAQFADVALQSASIVTKGGGGGFVLSFSTKNIAAYPFVMPCYYALSLAVSSTVSLSCAQFASVCHFIDWVLTNNDAKTLLASSDVIPLQFEKVQQLLRSASCDGNRVWPEPESDSTLLIAAIAGPLAMLLMAVGLRYFLPWFARRRAPTDTDAPIAVAIINAPAHTDILETQGAEAAQLFIDHFQRHVQRSADKHGVFVSQFLSDSLVIVAARNIDRLFEMALSLSELRRYDMFGDPELMATGRRQQRKQSITASSADMAAVATTTGVPVEPGSGSFTAGAGGLGGLFAAAVQDAESMNEPAVHVGIEYDLCEVAIDGSTVHYAGSAVTRAAALTDVAEELSIVHASEDAVLAAHGFFESDRAAAGDVEAVEVKVKSRSLNQQKTFAVTGMFVDDDDEAGSPASLQRSESRRSSMRYRPDQSLTGSGSLSQLQAAAAEDESGDDGSFDTRSSASTQQSSFGTFGSAASGGGISGIKGLSTAASNAGVARGGGFGAAELTGAATNACYARQIHLMGIIFTLRDDNNNIVPNGLESVDTEKFETIEEDLRELVERRFKGFVISTGSLTFTITFNAAVPCPNRAHVATACFSEIRKLFSSASPNEHYAQMSKNITVAMSLLSAAVQCSRTGMVLGSAVARSRFLTEQCELAQSNDAGVAGIVAAEQFDEMNLLFSLQLVGYPELPYRLQPRTFHIANNPINMTRASFSAPSGTSSINGPGMMTANNNNNSKTGKVASRLLAAARRTLSAGGDGGRKNSGSYGAPSAEATVNSSNNNNMMASSQSRIVTNESLNASVRSSRSPSPGQSPRGQPLSLRALLDRGNPSGQDSASASLTTSPVTATKSSTGGPGGALAKLKAAAAAVAANNNNNKQEPKPSAAPSSPSPSPSLSPSSSPGGALAKLKAAAARAKNPAAAAAVAFASSAASFNSTSQNSAGSGSGSGGNSANPPGMLSSNSGSGVFAPPPPLAPLQPVSSSSFMSSFNPGANSSSSTLLSARVGPPPAKALVAAIMSVREQKDENVDMEWHEQVGEMANDQYGAVNAAFRDLVRGKLEAPQKFLQSVDWAELFNRADKAGVCGLRRAYHQQCAISEK